MIIFHWFFFVDSVILCQCVYLLSCYVKLVLCIGIHYITMADQLDELHSYCGRLP